MTKNLIRWTVQTVLAVVGVLGSHDLAAAPEAWLNILAKYPWIAVVLTFGGGVGVTLTLQDIWRSRLPHRTVDWLADCAWAVRQFFLRSIQSGYVRAYYVPGTERGGTSRSCLYDFPCRSQIQETVGPPHASFWWVPSFG